MPALARWSPLALGFLAVIGAVAAPRQDPPPSKETEQAFQGPASAALKQKCAPCHQGAAAPNGADFAKFDARAAVADGRLSETALLYVRTGHMPPPGSEPLTRAEAEALAGFFESAASDAAAGADAGRVAMRRLNRLEYRNSVRDLLGVEPRLVDEFPSDDVGYGFDTIGSVLTLSPLLLEKYVASAEQAVAEVFPPAAGGVQARTGDRLAAPENSRATDDGELGLFTTSVAATSFRAGAGPGTLVVVLWAQQAGPEVARARVRLGGQVLGVVDVPGTRAQPTRVEFPVELAGGDARCEVGFVNDFYNPSEPDPARRDRNLYIVSVELRQAPGPSGPSPARARLFAGVPGAEGSDEAARGALERLASRAFRRPLAGPDRARVAGVYESARKSGATWEQAVQAGVVYVLCSPSFLFRPEYGVGRADGKGNRRLGPYEIASRLSFFLWASIPDEALLKAAGEGKLADPKGIEAEVERMLRDAKSRGLAEGFASQWLQLRKLEIHQADQAVFPGFGADLRADMAEESLRAFAKIVRENRPATDFFESSRAELSGRLARHYGLEPKGEGWAEYELPPDRRLGLLGQAAVLTVTSNPNRTSPVKRGKFVLEQILGTPLPPPPPDVGVIPDDEAAVLAGSIRERMERHAKDPSCAGCHRAMDPIGFALEAFDGVGRRRTMDGSRPVEQGGELPDGTRIEGPEGLRRALLARKGEFVRHLGSQLLTYGTGRGMRTQDRRHLDQVRDQCLAKGGRIGDLVKAVATSEPFRSIGRE
jgi:mono/diheme cytochrome c family protein